MYTLYFTAAAKQDFKKIAKSHLEKEIYNLLEIVKNDPFQNPPPFKKLLGIYAGLIRGGLIYNIGCSTR